MNKMDVERAIYIRYDRLSPGRCCLAIFSDLNPRAIKRFEEDVRLSCGDNG